MKFKKGDFVVVPRLRGRSAIIKAAIVYELKDGEVYKVILEDSYLFKPTIVQRPDRIRKYSASLIEESKRIKMLKGCEGTE